MKKYMIICAAVLAACSGDTAQTPPTQDGAAIHLNFEDTLSNHGQAIATSEVKDGTAKYKKGPTGRSYISPGDGQHLIYALADPLVMTHPTDISFSIYQEPGENPNPKGRASQAPLSFNGVFEANGSKKIGHIAFGITGTRQNLYANFTTPSGKDIRLQPEPDTMTAAWHRVKLRIDPIKNKTEFYFNDALVGEADGVPNIALTGISKIKVGTWHKTNEAFRGQIDEIKVSPVITKTAAARVPDLRR